MREALARMFRTAGEVPQQILDLSGAGPFWTLSTWRQAARFKRPPHCRLNSAIKSRRKIPAICLINKTCGYFLIG
jgi:uncharacterized membrane protein